MTQSTNLKLDLLSATDLFDTDKIKSNFEKIDSNVLIPTKIIDNCVTDNSLLPLSAKQGKLLQDQITKLNGDLSIGRIPNQVVYMSPNGKIDCNLLTDHFVLTKGKNFPTEDSFWYIQTIGYEINTDGTVKTGKQIAWQYTGIKLFVRDCYNDVWDSWTEYITKSDMSKVIKQQYDTPLSLHINSRLQLEVYTQGKVLVFTPSSTNDVQ